MRSPRSKRTIDDIVAALIEAPMDTLMFRSSNARGQKMTEYDIELLLRQQILLTAGRCEPSRRPSMLVGKQKLLT
jgi:hypothetical protein